MTRPVLIEEFPNILDVPSFIRRGIHEDKLFEEGAAGVQHGDLNWAFVTLTPNSGPGL
jgi:hypothetical protein